MTRSDEELHALVDRLTLAVERKIAENKKRLDEAPDFSLGKKARETNTVPSLEELAND